jgi:hypothetical protein
MSALEKWVLHLRQVRQILSIRVILIFRFAPILGLRRGKRESRKTSKISAAHLPEEYSKTDRLCCDPSRGYAHKNFPASSAAYGRKTDMATHVTVAALNLQHQIQTI